MKLLKKLTDPQLLVIWLNWTRDWSRLAVGCFDWNIYIYNIINNYTL